MILYDKNGNRIIDEPVAEDVMKNVLSLKAEVFLLNAFEEEVPAIICPVGVVLRGDLYRPDAKFGIEQDGTVVTFAKRIQTWLAEAFSGNKESVQKIVERWEELSMV